MARPKKPRKVLNPPQMAGYKPFGIQILPSETISLSFEEFESLKMVHYDNLSQEDASRHMDVSRPTFTRIYQRALKVITQAFVEGKAIEIEGGNYTFSEDWYRCRRCHKLIEGLHNHIRCEGCPEYGQGELIGLNK